MIIAVLQSWFEHLFYFLQRRKKRAKASKSPESPFERREPAVRVALSGVSSLFL